jgi:hypothetical protein
LEIFKACAKFRKMVLTLLDGLGVS